MKTAHLKTDFKNAFECYEAIGQWLLDLVPERFEEIEVCRIYEVTRSLTVTTVAGR